MLELRLLGTLELRRDGVPVPRARRQQTDEFWTYLVLHRDKPVPLSQAAAQLWPDAGESQARKNVVRHTYFITQSLPEPSSEGPWIVRERNFYRWNPGASIRIDIDRFDDAYRQFEQARQGKRWPTAAEHARRLVDDYSGLLGAHVQGDWIVPFRKALREQYVRGLHHLIWCEVHMDRWDDAISLGRRAVDADPTNEIGARTLTWLLARQGLWDDALATFQVLHESLMTAAGISPTAITIKLSEDIRNQTDLAGWTAKLLDPAAPELEGVVGTAVDGYRRVENLPIIGDTFVGRAQELESAAGLLRVSRLVTIVGAGGSGKTRLAMVLAEAVAGRYPGGVWWAALGDVSPSAALEPAVAAVMNWNLTADQGFAEFANKQAGDRPCLLILDNCEHVTDDLSPLVSSLLASCQTLTVLATSRSRLQLPGEAIWEIPPLTLPDEDLNGSADTLMESEAVQLFVHRVKASWPDYEVTSERLRAIGELCHLLGGLPLGIELAAARAGILEASEMAERLRTGFDFLARRDRSHDARHQSLRAALDWGYQLLSEPERVLLRRLSVFSGGFGAAAAAAICALPEDETRDSLRDHDILVLLDQLVSKSLVSRGMLLSGRRRYNLHPVVQQYAKGLLDESSELGQVERAHAKYFVEFAEQAGQELRGGQAETWLRLLKDERQNIHRAMSFLSGTGEWLLAARLGGSLWRHWATRGQLLYEREWLTEVSAHVNEEWEPGVRALAYHATGAMAYMIGDYDAAIRHFASSLTAYKSPDEHPEGFRLLLSLARVEMTHDVIVARSYAQDALHLAEQADNVATIAASSVTLADIAQRMGDLDQASQLLDAVEAISTEGALAFHERLEFLHVTTAVFVARSDYADAKDVIEERQHLGESLQRPMIRASNSNWLGIIASSQGRYDQAIPHFRQALTYWQQQGNQVLVARASHNLGELERWRGQYAVGELYLKRSLALKEQHKETWSRAFTLLALGELSLERGELERAETRAADGLAEAEHYKSKSLISRALRLQAGLALARGDLDAVRTALVKASDLVVYMGERRSAVQCLDLAAQLVAAKGSPETAAELLGTANVLLRTIESRRHYGERMSYVRLRCALKAALGVEGVREALRRGEGREWAEVLREMVNRLLR